MLDVFVGREGMEADAELGDPALQRARRSERILEQITRSVKDVALILLSPEGRIALWNEGAERLLGWSAAEVHLKDARLLFTAEDRERGLPEAELRRASEEGRADSDRWLQRKDGSRFWAAGSTSPIRDQDGRLEGFVSIFRDLTGRKSLEDELRRVNAALEERVRERTAELEDALKEMGAFSYSMAHDLRAPLRAMSGFARILEEDHGDGLSEEVRGYLKRITTSASFMQQMIEDLISYSRLTRAEIPCRALDPRPAVEAVLESLSAPIAEKKAEVVVESPLPPVLGHEPTLRQIFANLLGNALKFVEPGTSPRVRIRAEERPGAVRIWVEDNGIGIEPEHTKRIFGIFERLHPGHKYAGTGIGLAIVNRAVERMKGRAGVETAPGCGSRFWIELRRPLEPLPSPPV